MLAHRLDSNGRCTVSAPPPVPYSPSFSFTGFEAASPNTPKPGASLDVEFAGIHTSVASTNAALADIRRIDGAINNGAVSWDSLNPAVQKLFPSVTPRGLWATGTAYAVRDMIRSPDTGGTYLCAVAHTSGVWATDRAASLWFVLTVADAGGGGQLVPVPSGGDAGSVLTATGAGTVAFSPLIVTLTAVANGTAAAPAIAFTRDAGAGLYSPAIGAVGIGVGGTNAYTFTATTLAMTGNRIVIGKDNAKQAYVTSPTADAASRAFGFEVDSSGHTTKGFMLTQFGLVTFDGNRFTIAPVGYPNTQVTLGTTEDISGPGAIVGLAGGADPGVYMTENKTSPYRWSMAFDVASGELRFTPDTSTKSVRFSGKWVFTGTQTGLPGSLSNGVATNDIYVQGKAAFGTGGAIAGSIDAAGNATLATAAISGAASAGSLVVSGTLTVGGIAIAGPLTTYNVVGTLAMLQVVGGVGSPVAPGTIVNGSALQASAAAGSASGVAMTGTWRLLGYIPAEGFGPSATSLFVRVT